MEVDRTLSEGRRLRGVDRELRQRAAELDYAGSFGGRTQKSSAVSRLVGVATNFLVPACEESVKWRKVNEDCR